MPMDPPRNVHKPLLFEIAWEVANKGTLPCVLTVHRKQGKITKKQASRSCKTDTLVQWIDL